MFVVQVEVHVKPESVEAFKQATLKNAQASLGESGVVRFDVMQDMDAPTRFILVEIYRSTEDPGDHKETVHYQAWRAEVADMMAEPRKSTRYSPVFPEPELWEMSSR